MKYNPDIVKIACKVNSNRDNARLMSLLDNDMKMIVLGMGEKGKITRLFSILLGGFCSFAAVDSKRRTAEGQFTVDELNDYIKRLDFVG